MSNTRRRLAAFLAVLALLLPLIGQAAPAPAPPAAETPVWRQEWEHWYTLEIAGTPAGWMHQVLYENSTQYRTVSSTTIRTNRGGTILEVRSTDEFIETRAAEPVRATFTQKMAQQEMVTTWTFLDDHVRCESAQAGRRLEQKLPRPEGTWLTPMGVQRYWELRREAGAKEITYRSLSSDSGLEPVTSTHVFKGTAKYEFDGKKLDATVWTTTVSSMKGVEATTHFSSDGHLLQETAEVALGRLTTRIATRKEAMAAGAAAPPELMVTTFVEADKPIRRPRRSTRSTLRLRTREGDVPELPSAGAQRVERGSDKSTVTLIVDTSNPLPATEEEIADDTFRRASAMANADDPLVKKHAKRACRGVSSDPALRAEAMRRYVRDHISSKDLDTAFASASETARMRTGDCSEHGVLLCALLRAEGIPSRVAMGLVYMEAFAGERNIFGWHMWTQALIDGRWVDLDATLRESYDAAHVLTGTSSLADGMGAGDMAALLMLIGNLEIEVVDVGYERP